MMSSEEAVTYADGEVSFHIHPARSTVDRNSIAGPAHVDSGEVLLTTATAQQSIHSTGDFQGPSFNLGSGENDGCSGDMTSTLKIIYEELQALKRQTVQATQAQVIQSSYGVSCTTPLNPITSLSYVTSQYDRSRYNVHPSSSETPMLYSHPLSSAHYNSTTTSCYGNMHNRYQVSQGNYRNQPSVSIGYNRPSTNNPYQFYNVSQQSSHMSTRAQDHVKIPIFTGKEDWRMWIARFEAVAYRYAWNENEKLNHLLPRLEGQAGQFVFVQLPSHIVNNYCELVREMNNRFNTVETSRAFAAKFSRRNQKQGETAEEYAAELKMLYDKAHGYRDRRTRDEDLLRRFLDGIRDEEARFEIEFHKEPSTIDEAVYHVVNFIQTRNCYGDRRNRLARRTSENDEDDEHISHNARAVRAPSEASKEYRKSFHNRGNRQQSQDQNKEPMNQVMKEILQRLEQLEKKNNVSTPVSHVQQPKRPVTCFKCHQEGHYARNCPTRTLGTEVSQNTQSQDRSHNDSTPLN